MLVQYRKSIIKFTIKKEGEKVKLLKKYRNVILRIFDILIIVVAYYFSAYLVSDSQTITSEENVIVINTIILAIIIYSTILHIFKTYKNITRYENGYDYLVYILACLISYTIITAIKLTFRLGTIVSTKANLIAALIIVTSIVSYRVILKLLLTQGPKSNEKNLEKKNVLIIGAGDAARIVLRNIKNYI